MKTIVAIFLLFGVLDCRAQLTPTITQSSPVTINASSATCIPVFGSNTTAGTNVLVFAQWASTSVTATIADTLTNTWIIPALGDMPSSTAWSYKNSMGVATVAGWLVNRGIGGADTITVTFSGAVKNACVAIELGNLTYSPQEAVVNANYGGTQTAAMSVGPMAKLFDSSQLALCIGGDEADQDTVTAGAGYSVLQQGNGTGQYFFVLSQTLSKAAGTTPSCTATASSGSNQWMLTLITLDAALGYRNQPQTPLTVPDVHMPTTSGYTQATVCASSCTYTALATALTSVACGTVLTLTAGTIYTLDAYNLPSHSCDENHWIIVTTGGMIPPSGVRINPTNIPQMATVQSGNDDPIVDNSGDTNAAIDHYRFIGINFKFAANDDASTFALYLGSNAITETANRIIIDRCIIQGNPLHANKQGMFLNAANSSIVDSYFYEIHGLFNVWADAAALVISGHGESGYLIRNNFFSGSGHNVIFGGGGSGNVTDVTFINNWLWKNPCWIPASAGGTCFSGPHWGFKTSLELKLGTRVLIDSNIFDYTPLDTQAGYYVFVFNPSTAENPNARDDDVIVRNNLIRHTDRSTQVSGINVDANWVGSTMGVNTHRVAIYNNLIDDTGAWGSQSPNYELSVSNGPIDLQIYHNTFVTSQAGNSGLDVNGNSNPPPIFSGCVFADNIINFGSFGGWFNGNTGHYGKTALDESCYDYQFGNSALVGGLNSTTYPAGTLAPTDWTNASGSVRFVSYNGGNGGDYRLCTGLNLPGAGCPGASTLHNAASDGTDVGANVPSVLAATSPVTAGSVSVAPVPIL